MYVFFLYVFIYNKLTNFDPFIANISHHRETSQLTCSANQYIGLYIVWKAALTHYSPVLLFYIPWKHQKTLRFSDVFRGYRKATPGCNGLNGLLNQ